jgi:RNA polymerase sigma-70 factor (ECF subfamily)
MPEHASDAILLERFVSRREEAAFAALVERHGPLVEGICRRVLKNDHDVEDVAQATFLILARKAAGIAWRDSVGGWLSSVARRLAWGARSDLARLKRREMSFTSLAATGVAESSIKGRLADKFHPIVQASVELERRELRRLLDDELLRLPEKYRAPVVLCDLEGRTHEDAARQLGCPAGSMSRRLERARFLLRQRLILRGLSLAICLAGCAIGTLGAWRFAHRAPVSPAAVRQAMSALRPLSGRANSIERLLPPVGQGDYGADDRRHVATLARQAARVAGTIRGHDPGRYRDDWREYVAEMRASAILLAQATEENDAIAMLSAARRMDVSCRKCHNLFCQ